MAVLPPAQLLSSVRPLFSTPSHVTPSHPQLRDLLVCTPEQDAVSVVTWDSIATHDLYQIHQPDYTKLKFSPSTIAYGCGLVCAGGQAGELALRSADRNSRWLHQIGPEGTGAGSINNSIDISPSPLNQSRPRLLVSCNDETIKVYEVAQGCRPPDWSRAKRRRKLERVSDVHSSDDRDRFSADDDDAEMLHPAEVEEEGVWDTGTECTLSRQAHADIKLHTAVNQASVSPDGTKMVAVGDTAEIFCFDVRNGCYEMTGVFEGSRDAAFSTDWSHNSLNFTVGSQDGFVHVYDVRMQVESTQHTPKRLTSIRTTQRGPAGAVRKVKFSPGRVAPELLAFTEHRRVVQVVDARTFEAVQIVQVPLEDAPPPPRPVPHGLRPPTRLRKFVEPPSPETVETASTLPAHLQASRDHVLRLLDGASSSTARTGSSLQSSRANRSTRSQAWNSTYELVPSEPMDTDTNDPTSELMTVSSSTHILTEDDCPTDPLSYRLDRRQQRTRISLGSSAADSGNNVRLAPMNVSQTAVPTSTTLLRNRLSSSLQRPNLSGGVTPNLHFYYGDSASSPRPYRNSTQAGRGPATIYYGGGNGTTTSRTTQQPSSLSILGGFGSGVAIGSSTGYHSTSSNFPIESCADDLLGLDWDEWGDSLFVATGSRVWEWQVDNRARRCFGTSDLA